MFVWDALFKEEKSVKRESISSFIDGGHARIPTTNHTTTSVRYACVLSAKREREIFLKSKV